ncbi:PPA1309 family protein [Nocardioides gilvus]|uniref:PPA1309 family protein n=1 Tax=Nocardioides gilvus TaxID=1735589 RepID=UPI000D749FF3|nr:PPA1309 family protein [Nocardioides gilvus]
MTQEPSEGTTLPDPALASAVLEVEAHVGREGWDQPARLYALVDTHRFIAAEPQMAEMMGLAETAVPGSLTAIEQEQYNAENPIEEALETIVWPPTVDGCAVVIERLVLPPEVDEEIPTDPTEAAAFARQHPLRQEVRMVAGATRTGSTYCALRLKAHDDEQSVVDGTDLVPGLIELVLGTLREVDENGETS